MTTATVVYDLGDDWKAEFYAPPAMTPRRVIARLAQRLNNENAYQWRKGISSAINMIAARNGCWDSVKGLELE